MNRIEVLTHASTLHDEAQLDALKSRLLDDLRAVADFEITEVKKPSGDCLAVILVLTGGVEREVLKTVAQLPPPSILIAHPGHNSLPASLEILARIRRDGGEGRILFGDAASIVPELQLELILASAWKALRFSRIGLIGEPSEWLVASDVDSAFLKGRLAVDLITVDIKELMDRIRSATVSRKELAAFTREAEAIIGPNPEDIREAITVYQGLRALVDEYRLAACSVRCFDLVTDMQTTGCYALSRLNDEGIPAGCEGICKPYSPSTSHHYSQAKSRSWAISLPSIQKTRSWDWPIACAHYRWPCATLFTPILHPISVSVSQAHSPKVLTPCSAWGASDWITCLYVRVFWRTQNSVAIYAEPSFV